MNLWNRIKWYTRIPTCYFSEHVSSDKQVVGQRKVRGRRIFLYGILPVIVGCIMAWQLPAPEGNNLALVVSVMGVIAAVLLGLLPLAHSILAQTDTAKKYESGEAALAKNEITRVETLQDLHSAISWAVILLVGGLVSCCFLAFDENKLLVLSKPLAQWWRGVVVPTTAAVIYSVMASTAMTFFSVARDVFESMENHANYVKDSVRRNVGTK